MTGASEGGRLFCFLPVYLPLFNGFSTLFKPLAPPINPPSKDGLSLLFTCYVG